MQNFRHPLSVRGLLAALAVTAICLSSAVYGLPAWDIPGSQPVITLAKSAAQLGQPESAPITSLDGKLENPAIASMKLVKAERREFARTTVGGSSAPQLFTLEFHGATTLTAISVSGDFHVVDGSTCVEGRSYVAGNSCGLEIVITPRGPGRRTGRLSIAHTASPTPFLAPVSGSAFGPALQFTPSLIETVPGSYNIEPPFSAGAFSTPAGLAVDGGDNLYIADTGHGLVLMRDSSGTISTVVGGGTNILNNSSSSHITLGNEVKLNGPSGVAVDASGNVYVTDTGDDSVLYGNPTGFLAMVGGGNTDLGDCAYAMQCNITNVSTSSPYAIAVDSSENVFFDNRDSMVATDYTAVETNYEFQSNSIFSLSPIQYSLSPGVFTPFGSASAFGVDSSDDLISAIILSADDTGSTAYCAILGQTKAVSEATALQSIPTYSVAGSGRCGFSGDGGRAIGAEISTAIGQLAFDAAGNLYFTDTDNNRVRRVEAVTGVIRTIAGNGLNGYTGDGGASTSAAVQSPMGLAVDSTGQIYATSLAGNSAYPTGTTIRNFGTVGVLNLGSAGVGTPSAAQTVLVSNVGNAALDFTHVGIASGNTGDFAIDPNTTSCNFTLPLSAGESCNIGFIFTPAGAGTRSAVVNITDNTVNGLNTIQLTGVGSTSATLAPTSMTFASTAVNSKSAAQTATLTNTGSGALTIGSIGLQGVNSGSFSETTTCGAALAGGASCTVSVTFNPIVPGALTAILVVTDNAGGGQQSVALAGTGASAAATAVLSPTSLTFASQAVGSTSAGQQIKLTNGGTAALTVTSIKLTGSNPGDFAINTNCGSTVTAGAACLVNAVFKPTATGTRTAAVTYTTSAGTSTVALTGTGTAAAAKPILSPTPVAFSSQTVATASAAKAFTLTNAGTVSMTIGSFGFTGANAGDFTQTHSCGATLAASANCTISVVFKPAAMGARSATLVVSTSAGSASAAVSGNGVAAAKVALASGANPVAKGQIFSLAVQVGAEANGQASALANVPPTGQVQLMEGGRVLAEGSLGDSAVTLRVGDLSPGLHVLRAVYLGDAHYGVSVSNAINEMVSEGVTVPGPARPGRLD